MNAELMSHIWTNEERIDFIRSEIEREKGIKILKGHAENKKEGLRISKEFFLETKLVNSNKINLYEKYSPF